MASHGFIFQFLFSAGPSISEHNLYSVNNGTFHHILIDAELHREYAIDWSTGIFMFKREYIICLRDSTTF